MYDRVLNQSRTSLTTNSSKTARIVRKRDSNISTGLPRSRSKNKQDQCNTSFEEYLTRQSKYFGVENAEISQWDKYGGKIQSRGSEALERSERINGGSVPLTLSQTLSSLQMSRNSIIQRGDRYIGHKVSLNQDNTIETRQINLRQGGQTKTRKREPTPVKSKKQLGSPLQNNEAKGNSNQIFQLQLRITGLEETVALERRQKQMVQNQLRQALSDVQNMKEILSQIQMQNKILEGEKKNAQEKIEKLQKTVLQSQNSLTAAQNNLNKLRQTIKQNRLTELQFQFKKLQKANDSLKQTNTTNAQIIASLNQKLAAATKQLEEARKLGDLETLAAKQSMKEQYLEKELQRCKAESQRYKVMSQAEKEKFLDAKVKEQEKIIEKLNMDIGGLLVKIHCLEYFKSKQVSQIKQNSEAQIKSLRVKYSKMVVQLKTKKPKQLLTQSSKLTKSSSPVKSKSNYDIRCKCVTSASPTSIQQPQSARNWSGSCGQEYRASSIGNQVFFLEKRGGINQDNFLLELSPE